MTSKHVKLLYFMVTFPLIFGSSNTTRFHLDSDVRGNSFGLENFLFQTYKDVAPKESTHRVTAKPKRVRPQSYRAPSLDRGQTYGLENLAPQVYYSNRLKPSPVRPQPQYQIYIPNEPFLDLNKSKEISKEELTTRTTKVPELLTQETTTEDTKTERVRKRIMMKRRRKRPTNATQGESTEINVSPTLQPIKLPTISQAPTTVKTKLPIHDSNEDIIPTTQEQLIRTTPQTKEAITEVVTEQEVVTEYSTTKETPKSSTVRETTTNKPYTLNLKTFLKQQTETLSLSELLQTQNLSLADLLRNSKDASAILKAKEWMSSTTPSPSYGFRRKTSNRLEINKNIPESEPQRKPQSEDITTSRPSFNRFQPKFSRTKIGEKVNAKPEEKILNQNENYPREILTSTKRTIVNYNYSHKNFDPHNRLSELRLKLKNFQRKPVPSAQPEVTSPKQVKAEVTETVSITSTASSVSLLKETEKSQIRKNEISLQSANNPEIFLILPSKLKPEVEKRPERYNRTNRLPALKRFGQDKVKQSENLIIRPLKYSNEEDDSSGQSFEQNNYKEEEPTQTTTEDKVSQEEEYKPVKVPYEEELNPIKVPYERKPDSKDELIELLKFGQNADRLQKILSSRNMTIQELLDNREKPSTQTSLSELFSKKHPEFLSTTSTEPPIIFDSLPNFGMEINNFKTPEFVSYDEPYAEESVPSIATIELAPNREAKQFLPIPENKESDLTLEPDDLKADTSNVEDSALWKLSERGTYYGSSNPVGVTVRHESGRTINPKNRLQESDIILLESLQRSPETNRKFRINLEDYAREESIPLAEDIEKSYVPPAVKSAIIASGVVMGIALFVFIAIFAACGWKQRQIRLKGSSSILGSTLTKTGDKSKRKNTLSPVSFKETSSYKKTIDFDNESNESGASNTSSYFWGTLKNPFRSRTNTLKTRLEKEEKMKEDRMTLRRNESRRKGEYKMNEMPIMYDIQDDRFVVRKAERDRNAINMSFNFKRTSSSNNINHFNECEHGY